MTSAKASAARSTPSPQAKPALPSGSTIDVLDWFREQVTIAGGGNYQTQINEVLRQYIQQQHSESLEETMRRIFREELQRVN
jgi:uncharacterized protein (DUF4415 family)